MICSRCKREIPDESAFCLYCGKKLHRSAAKKAANGQGCVYKRGNTWTVRMTIGSTINDTGEKQLLFKYKGGFPTRIAALEYVKQIKKTQITIESKSLSEVYYDWKSGYESRIGQSTMAGYKAAFNYYKSLWGTKVDKITAKMLQECLSNCPSGHRTKQMMKVIANLLMKYAIDEQMITVNPAQNLYVGNDPTENRDPITEKELEIIKGAFESERYAKYIYCLCYLGFRPTEFLKLTKDDFHFENDVEWLISGSKTEAGKNRPVTIPPVISPLIHERLECPDSDYLFPRYDPKTGKASPMKEDYFRKWVFQPLMSRLGIEGKVPYSARHTYSNKIKGVNGADRDKAALMGHADYKTTKKFYQSTDLEDRKKITDQMK